MSILWWNFHLKLYLSATLHTNIFVTGFKLEIAVEKEAEPVPVRKSANMEVLTLTHFNAAPRLGFGSLKLGEERMCTLMLRNPHDYEQRVRVEKVPEKKHFSVSCRDILVGPNDQFPLEVRHCQWNSCVCRNYCC